MQEQRISQILISDFVRLLRFPTTVGIQDSKELDIESLALRLPEGHSIQQISFYTPGNFCALISANGLNGLFTSLLLTLYQRESI